MLTIIGCGNPNRSDDGAGVAVAQRLMSRLAQQVGSVTAAGAMTPGGEGTAQAEATTVRVFDAGTNGIEVMFKARGSRELVLIDASNSDGEPGSIYEVPGERLASVQEPGYGLHGFRWDHALYAGKRIYGREFPERVTVYLIERQTLELGIGLSEPVERAVAQVVELLLNRVRMT